MPSARPLTLLALFVVGCGAATAPVVQSPEPPARFTPILPLPPPLFPHEDYERLRPLRNYYRVISIGEYQHHFRAFYDNYETVTARYVVSVETGEPRLLGTGFGVNVVKPPQDVPPSAAPMAKAIRRDLRLRGATTDQYTVVRYLGAYREVLIEEFVPTYAPGEPVHGRFARVRLRVDETFTSLVPNKGYGYWSGGTFQASNDPYEHADRFGLPHWIDVSVDREGTPRLWDLFYTDRVRPEVRATFLDAVLAAARRVHAGEPDPPLEQLAVQRDPSLVPKNFADALEVWFTVRAEELPPGRESRFTSARFTLSTPQVLADGAQGEAQLTLPGGTTFDLSLLLRVAGPRPMTEARGPTEIPLELVYSLRKDFAGPAHWGVFPLRAQALVDEGRVALLGILGEWPTHHFEGDSHHASYRTHVDARSLLTKD